VRYSCGGFVLNSSRPPDDIANHVKRLIAEEDSNESTFFDLSSQDSLLMTVNAFGCMMMI